MLFAVSNFRNRWGMRPIFFSKCWKFLVDFTILETNSENIFNFGDNWIWIGCVKHSVLARERILVIGSRYVNRQSQDFRYYWKSILRTQFLAERSKSMRKLLPCRCEQCFWPFNMLTVHKCSDMGLFRHFRNHAFCSL